MRGLKSLSRHQISLYAFVAPFTGAWIEMAFLDANAFDIRAESHPSRVRGLKLFIPGIHVADNFSRTLHGCVD